jgi:hypothetical protein
MENNYKIPHQNMSSLQAKFDKLQKKVLKLRAKGVECADVSFTDTGIVREPQENGAPDKLFHVVTVQGPTPSINGWTFLATLQHTTDGNIIGKVPTISTPEGFLNQYREVEPVCNHCNLSRRRNDTYLIRNDSTNEVKQVGSSCLGDFLCCTSPESLAAIAEIIIEAGLAAQESEFGQGGCEGKGVPLDQYLPYVCAAIRLGGWISRTSARESGCVATADIAWSFGAMSPSDCQDKIKPEQCDYDQAARVLAHATEKLVSA